MLEELERELGVLDRRHVEIAERIRHARDFGDIAENAEYTEAKNEQSLVEGRIMTLESMIRRFIAEPVIAYKPKKGAEPEAGVAKMLERGMTYVDEWAQPGSDKPPVAKGAAAPAPAAMPAATPALVTPDPQGEGGASSE